MRQAIVTKYHGPTNHRGASIRVKAQAGTMSVPWNHELDAEENHAKAAFEFAAKQGWADSPKELVGGGMPNDDGYCFVIRSLYTDEPRWHMED